MWISYNTYLAKTYANEADLIIYVIDASRQLDQNDYDIIQLIGDKKAIVLLNKWKMLETAALLKSTRFLKYLNKTLQVV